MWRYLGCHSGGQCHQGSGIVRLVLGVLCFLGGVSYLVLVDLSARGSVPTFTVKQYVPRIGGVIWVFTEVVSAVKYQSQYRSYWAFSISLAVSSQLVLTSGGYRWPPARSDVMVVMMAHSFHIPYVQRPREGPQPWRVQLEMWVRIALLLSVVWRRG